MIVKDKYNIGLNITEEEYRALSYPSYSYFSDLEKVELDVNKLGTKSNKYLNDLDGIIYGKYVDGLLLENKEPEDLIVVEKKPSGKPKMILKALKNNLEYLPNKDIFHKANEPIIMGACDALQYYNTANKRDYKIRLEALRNYKEYFEKYEPGKTIITKYMYDNALRAVNSLKSLSIFTNPDLEVIPQIKIVEEIKGIKIKAMLDMVIIDHKNKTITPCDLKTGSTKSDDFITNGYIGWNYYIQSKLYSLLLFKRMFENMMDFKDYSFESFKFIYYNRMKSDWIIFDSKDTPFNLGNANIKYLKELECSEYIHNSGNRINFTIKHKLDSINDIQTFNKPSLNNLITTLKNHLQKDITHPYYNALT